MRNTRATPVMAIASGKGGVGKTNVAINLAVALARQGRRPLIMDADLGLGNVDVLLGLTPRYNLSHVLSGEKRIQDILLDGPEGMGILPAASGVASMASLDARARNGLMEALGALERRFDYLLVDLAAGISPEVLSFAQAADERLVIVTNEPASITDAYALIKVLRRDHGVQRFRILPNMVRDEAEGKQLFSRLSLVADRYLDVDLRLAGVVPADPVLRSAVRCQAPVLQRFPDSAAAQAFQDLGRDVLQWPPEQADDDRPRFFASRLFAEVAGTA